MTALHHPLETAVYLQFHASGHVRRVIA